MEKLDLSIGILSWRSGQTLVNTLQTYFDNEFLHQVNDVCILFQEVSEQDKEIEIILVFLILVYKIILE